MFGRLLHIVYGVFKQYEALLQGCLVKEMQYCCITTFPVSPGNQVRTAFNILGPLLNPADAAYGLIGVYSPAISGLMAATLQRLGTKRALVVHSHGLDELTPMGDAEILEVTPSGTRSYRRGSRAVMRATFSMLCSLVDCQTI